MELIAYIRQLIEAHDYVVIPGFGGFVGKYAPASIHPGTHEFSPPNKSLAFNRNLTNDDGLLVHHLANTENISNDSARKRVDFFASGLNAELNNSGLVKLEGIGRIFKDIEGRIRFKQDEEAMLLTTAYGLPAFQKDPILRKKLVDTSTAIKSEEDSEEQVRHIPTWVWAVAAIFIGLMIIVGSYFALPGVQQKTKSLMGWNGDSLIQQDAEANAAYSTNIDWSFENMKATAPSLPEEVQTPYMVSVNTTIPKGYFVVVGSFANRNRAQNLYTELSNKDWNAFLFPEAENGFSRVAIFVSESNPFETSQILQDLRNNYRQDAWVVKNN